MRHLARPRVHRDECDLQPTCISSCALKYPLLSILPVASSAPIITWTVVTLPPLAYPTVACRLLFIPDVLCLRTSLLAICKHGPRMHLFWPLAPFSHVLLLWSRVAFHNSSNHSDAICVYLFIFNLPTISTVL